MGGGGKLESYQEAGGGVLGTSMGVVGAAELVRVHAQMQATPKMG